MYQGIFGALAPKIVYDLGGSGETTVLLNYWVPTKDEPESEKEIINESELEADRDIIPLGDFWAFEGYVNLLKYKSLYLIRNKFEEIYQFNKKQVTLYKHMDGDYCRDSSGNPVPFIMKAIPKNYQTLDYRDVLVLKFRSLREVNFSDNSPIYPQTNEIIMNETYLE